MLVFSALTPHPPLSIPAIGKDNINQIKKTVNALRKTGDFLAEIKPETLIIISPHGHLIPGAFTINQSTDFTGNFEKFGDLTTKLNFKGDLGLTHQIKESMETKINAQLISEPILDHGVTVPLFYLSEKFKNFQLIPIGYSNTDLKQHYLFGRLIKEVIFSNKKRVAVVSSGDMSHCLTKEAPGGFSEQGPKFDRLIQSLIKNKKTDKILNLDQEFIEAAGECGLRSLVILLGILDGVNYQPQLLSYEGSFGVGYLVVNFKIV